MAIWSDEVFMQWIKEIKGSLLLQKADTFYWNIWNIERQHEIMLFDIFYKWHSKNLVKWKIARHQVRNKFVFKNGKLRRILNVVWKVKTINEVA